MPVLIEDILNTTRMFLNDQNIQLWTDEVLMPMLQRAHGELQVKLRQRAAPIMKTHLGQFIQAMTTQLNTPIPDMVSPIQILESAPGGQGTIMTESDPLPLKSPSVMLNWWQWDGSTIQFIGATTLREILVFYWRELPLPTDGSQTLQIIDGEMWLAPRTAAIAAASVGEEATSATAATNAESMLEIVILSNRGRAPQAAGTASRP